MWYLNSILPPLQWSQALFFQWHNINEHEIHFTIRKWFFRENFNTTLKQTRLKLRISAFFFHQQKFHQIKHFVQGQIGLCYIMKQIGEDFYLKNFIRELCPMMLNYAYSYHGSAGRDESSWDGSNFEIARVNFEWRRIWKMNPVKIDLIIWKVIRSHGLIRSMDVNEIVPVDKGKSS